MQQIHSQCSKTQQRNYKQFSYIVLRFTERLICPESKPQYLIRTKHDTHARNVQYVESLSCIFQHAVKTLFSLYELFQLFPQTKPQVVAAR